jgi:hypothetical protein
MCYPMAMSTNIPCPKCGSANTYVVVEVARYVGQRPDQIFTCYTCGKRVYGAEAVTALLAAEQTKINEAKKVAEDTARKAREAKAAVLQKKCAWPPCWNDHTSSSKYCSRTCSDKYAHARDKERKMAKRATAAVPPRPSGQKSS